jgi:hypothetical protein
MAKIDISVNELVNKVRRGEISLPEMQRRYVWTATRVRDLLDSLYRGYPSGSILVWDTDAEVETRDLAVSPTQAPTTSSQQLLLDGQQRLTSLTAVLSGAPVMVRNRKRPIDILFNLEHPEGPPVEVMELESEELTATLTDIEGEEAERDIQAELKKRTFVVAATSLRNDPLWVPVSDIFSKTESEILRRIGINSDDERWDKYTERIQRVKKIADYQYVMQVLERNMSYEEVTEIFVRVNSLGVKLRGSDLALAQITSKWKGFMHELEEYAACFGDNQDYLLDSGILVRTMVAFATGQSKFKTVGRIKLEDLKDSWEKAKDGIEHTINFLRANAHIEKLGLLSSPMLLVPMAYYFVREDGSLSETQEKYLLKWLYYAHMRGHYGMGSSETILDRDLSTLVRGGSLEDLLQVLSDHVKKFEVDERDVAGKGVGSPLFSMLFVVFKANGAKDWKTGLALSDRHLGSAHKLQFHHIFPKSLLQEHGYEKREINEFANMAFIGGKTNRQILNKLPREYLEHEIIAKRGEDALTTQLVTTDRALWELDAYPQFLTDRRQGIAKAINDFMSHFSN